MERYIYLVIQQFHFWGINSEDFSALVTLEMCFPMVLFQERTSSPDTERAVSQHPPATTSSKPASALEQYCPRSCFLRGNSSQLVTEWSWVPKGWAISDSCTCARLMCLGTVFPFSFFSYQTEQLLPFLHRFQPPQSIAYIKSHLSTCFWRNQHVTDIWC